MTGIYQRFAASQSLNLRVIGLAGLIQRGDANALVETERQINSFTDQFDRLALTKSIDEFRNPDPVAVQALSRLATSGGKNSYLAISATYSLFMIHTRDALPYLVALLDGQQFVGLVGNQRSSMRERAVGGISLFVANLPIPQTDSFMSTLAAEWTLQRSRKSDADLLRIQQTKGPYESDDTVRYFHMARFKSPSEEAECIAFWKNWWNQHKSELMP